MRSTVPPITMSAQSTPEERLRQIILDSVNDGVFTVDGLWHITSFNRAAERITGVPRAEAIGRPCCDVFRASICENACTLRRTLETDQPVVNKTIYIINASGQRIPVSISTAILRDAEGRMLGGVETFRDLSKLVELERQLKRSYTFADIIGRSSRMQQLFEILPTISESDSTVLIQGTSGTGKELFARAIHNLSGRRRHRFVAVNCGALPDTLLESELFGYKKGAFTDAHRDKPGRFSIADRGTLFLDEIADISAAMQSKLLRVLQERTFEPLGSVESVKTNVRVIVASNRSLDEMVREGGFREDLFYRINVIQLILPPLADRREDIPLLADHFIAKYNRLQSKDVPGMSEEALALLLEHDYPGNIRELENIIEHAFVLCRGGMIEPRHLPHLFRERAGLQSADDAGRRGLKGVEAAYVADVVRRHGGNRSAAARAMGMHPSTLYRKIRSLGVALPSTDGRHRRQRSGALPSRDDPEVTPGHGTSDNADC